MHAQAVTVLSLGAALVAGFDAAGFPLAGSPSLIVAFGKTTAMNGVVVDKAATAQAPVLAVPSQTTATSLAILMVDLDIPSNTKPTTFLHWFQSDLTVASQASTVTTAEGNAQGFAVTNAKNAPAIAAYTPPNPPAKAPLSHRYTEILLDTSGASSASVAALQAGAKNRVNFDIAATLAKAGLTDKVVAWNFFNVTNPGSAKAAAVSGSLTSAVVATNTSSSSGSVTSSSASRNGTAIGVPSNGTRPTVPPGGGAPGRHSFYPEVLALCVLAAVSLAL